MRRAVQELWPFRVLGLAHLHIGVIGLLKLTCKMTIRTARLDLGEAEPIRFRLSYAVSKILAIDC